MAWPILFNSLTNPQGLVDFDNQFNAVTATLSIPSIASGTNAISLTPVTNVGALQNYQELCGARFRAAGSSSGPVTAQINGLGFLPVFKADGVTQCSTGDLISGFQYTIHYSAALNAGLGGFFLESPSVQVPVNPWFTPGGRITCVASAPVLTASQGNTGNLYYAPYVHPFVPIFNGSNFQMYQFTSSLADTVGLSMTLGSLINVGQVADVFVFLNAGVPTMALKLWTNPTTRALGLAIFGGLITNGGASTFGVSFGGGTISIPVNQATWLGSIACNNGINGNVSFVFGGAASGGIASQHYIYNYYNQVLFVSQVQDTGVQYTYSSSTVRNARASSGNVHNILQGASEKAATFVYNSREIYANAASAAGITGIGFNSNTTMAVGKQSNNVVATTNMINQGNSILTIGWTGLQFATALEGSDGVNNNGFDGGGLNNFVAQFWA